LQVTFGTAGTAFSQGMSTWSSSPNTARKSLILAPSSDAKTTLPKVCQDFEAQVVEVNGEADLIHLLVNDRPHLTLKGDVLRRIGFEMTEQPFPRMK
jgi:REP element-mobilizing transposase RayT